MKTIVDEIRNIARNIGLNKHLQVLECQKVWSDTVGESVSRETSVVSIKDKTLLVSVSSSVWLNELMFMKRDIIVKLKRHDVMKEFKDIRFMLCSESLNKAVCKTKATGAKKEIEVDVPPEIKLEIRKMKDRFSEDEVSDKVGKLIEMSYIKRQQHMKDDRFMGKVCEIMNYLRKEPDLNYFDLTRKYGKYSVDEYYFAFYNRS